MILLTTKNEALLNTRKKARTHVNFIYFFLLK